LNNITKPGRYKMAAEDYHADPVAVPSLSSSIAKLLIGQTALHAWTAHPRFNPGAEEENEARFDRGKACHILVLGDEERFQVVTGFDDWRKKEAQERRAQARANGLIPLLEHQIVDFPPEAKQYADAKVDEALDLWAYCIKTGNWPGYPAFTCTLEVPPWIGGEFEARKVRKDNARREGRELYADMLAFQAPT
jgi:hypothetical protein